jgi:hypothetical protein
MVEGSVSLAASDQVASPGREPAEGADPLTWQSAPDRKRDDRLRGRTSDILRSRVSASDLLNHTIALIDREFGDFDRNPSP